jgi:predicted RNA binding protein YcfA (HicA-like mRNA interferase family)
MRLPRDLSGGELIKALTLLGYKVTRQAGSYIRLTTPRSAICSGKSWSK